jgi:hypothetical protein
MFDEEGKTHGKVGALLVNLSIDGTAK